MKVKVSEATPVQIDWMVATAQQAYGGLTPSIDTDLDGTLRVNCGGQYPDWSTDWAQGGPIIEREKIAVDPDADDGQWAASTRDAPCYWTGHPPLIAAMRCYVASKMGDEVEVPEELA